MQIASDQTKKRIKEQLLARHGEASAAAIHAEDHIDKLLIKRFGRLVSVRRFVLLWSLLFLAMFLGMALQFHGLSKYYQTLRPVPGGIYNEGLIGTFTNANPLYATGSANNAVSHLVFSGLFKYDNNNQLVGDLAEGYKIGSVPTKYIVRLKPNIKWQDGKPFTADDVVFTYKTIQNIEAQSSLYSSWQGISVTRLDDHIVTFDLPNQLSSFPYSMTNGIVPAHLLSSVPPEQLRSVPFNTSPIGTGPFAWKFVAVSGSNTEDRQQRITLAAYKNYWAGRPKLDGFNLITFSDDRHLLGAFNAKQVNAMSGLDSLPPGLTSDTNIQSHVTPLTSEVVAFYNNSRPLLSDVNIRRALNSAVDRRQLKDLSAYPLKLADSPFLKGQLGYDPTAVELPYDPVSANKLLDDQGWVRGADGYRAKAAQKLAFTLVSQDSHDYTQVAGFLQKGWKALGVKVSVQYYSSEDLQVSVIANHGYDVLLYGISIGVDPDVYAYWDSTQASITSQGHLNLSEYKSKDADQALEGGRTRQDPALRAVKYKNFLTKWRDDAPALALYQPNVLYVTRGPVFNYDRKSTNSAADRFYNVDEWMIRQKKQTF